jgi:glucose/arabinose dehydrogenase
MVNLATGPSAAHHQVMQTNRATPRRLAGILATAILVLGLGAPSATSAATVLNPVVSGLDSPVFVTSAKDGSGRLFVVEQTGKIRVIKGGVLLSTPLIDLTTLISTGGERGVLGLAFHPSFKTNGLFYVYYTRTDGDIVIDQYKTTAANGNVADPASVRRIITIDHPNTNHNGGTIVFDKAGYLFVGTGDGGTGGALAQSKDTLLGKLLRINVNGFVGSRQYTIPSGNPYVGKTGLDEIWSYGLRNPWRFSFDRATGDLWIGDVGQRLYEEIDRSTVAGSNRGRGVNFGWNVMEGRHCYSPSTGCSATGRFLPVVEYPHSQGCSVTGGYVYRGKAVPSLVGRYVFGDYCSGTIWSVPKGGASPMTKALVMDTAYSISSFGEDEAGELYLVDRGGTLYRFGTR